MRSKVRDSGRASWFVAVSLLGVCLSLPATRSAAAGYNPDPYCQFHVMGSLYGDASGNGAANGSGWDPQATTWRLASGSAVRATRFERCARWMVRNNIGGNGTAVVTRNNNAVSLANFWPAGRSVPFPHDAMTPLVSGGSPLEKRAFLMSVIEGEGERCDPNTNGCATAQIADNSRTTSGGTNPTFYEHLTALVQVAVDAGLVTTFTATGGGCNPLSQTQLVTATGGAVCIRSADYPVIRTWPVAACERVPGYGTLGGYACGQPDEPSGVPPPPPSAPVSVSLSPASITIGASSTLTWDGGPSTSCTASGAWSGPLAIAGSTSVGPPAVGSYAFTLTCDAGTASTLLTVTDPSAVAITAFGSTPDPIAPGGAGSLRWTTTGMDAGSCKIRAGGKLLGSRLPTSSSGWRIPGTWLKNGTKFNLVCSSSGTNYSRSFTITVR